MSMARPGLLLGVLALTTTILHVALAQTKAGTLAVDKKALRLLFRSWGRPKNLETVWTNEDPCTVPSHDMQGLSCGLLDTPGEGDGGQPAWFYVRDIKLYSGPDGGANYAIQGTLPGAAFANGSLAQLEILDVSFNQVEGIIPTEVTGLLKLTRLALNNNNMNGTIPAGVTALTNLQIMWLDFNNFTGAVPAGLDALAPTLMSVKLGHNLLYGEIPPSFAGITRLLALDLSYNQLSLTLPPQLTTLTNLTGLSLQNNFLTGTIPVEYGNFQNLVSLKLSKNALTGPIPTTLANIKTLSILALDNNQFTGTIPDALASLPSLKQLSLQFNNFTGTVGPAFANYSQAFRYNNKLCNDLTGQGYQPCMCTNDLMGKQTCDPATGPGPCVCPEGSLPAEEEGGLATAWIIVITVGGALMLLLLIALLWWGYRTGFGRKKTGGWEYAGKIRSFPDVRAYRSQAYDPDEIDGYSIQTYDPTPSGGVHSRRSSAAGGADVGQGLTPDPTNGSAAGTPHSTASSSSTAAAFARKFGRSLNNQLTMRQFAFDELQLATNNFSPDNIVSTDGSRKTYSGVLPSGTFIAVKELEGGGAESVEAFAAAVEVFSLVRCPQLVEVLGFSCGRSGTRLLVYELMPNGSLDLHLHDLDSSSPPLDWATRMSVASEVAKALAYLHSMSPQMVHQHLQASTVLLDDHLHAKLSDYCLDSLRNSNQGAVPHAASTNIAVAAGTAAPELAWSSQPTPRTDVYAFGVLLLEVITGRRPIDSSRPPTEQSLVRWVKPRLTERSQVESMVDKKLQGSFSSAALYQVALLASQCIQTDPESRPSMVQAVEVLQNVQGLPNDVPPAS